MNRRAASRTANYLGKGIYTISQVAQLTGVPTQSIRRWVNGYVHPLSGRRKPIVHRSYPKIEGKVALSFKDMIEIRVLYAFRNKGISWGTLEIAHERASRVLETSHPFCTERFRTDGHSIFLNLAGERDDSKLLDLARNQYAFESVLSPFLEDLVFSREGEAIAWRPSSGDKQVILDPQRSFGQPIVDEFGVPTEVLSRSLIAEGDARRVAAIYRVSVDAVRAAHEFEQTLQAA